MGIGTEGVPRARWPEFPVLGVFVFGTKGKVSLETERVGQTREDSDGGWGCFKSAELV
jgi:hypothetical protein